MKLISLTQGQFAKVDDDDFETFGSLKWCAIWDLDTKSFYVRRTVTVSPRKRTVEYLHRVVMGNPKSMKVDHINHNTLDCQRANLRVCTTSQNAMNRAGSTRNSQTGVRGVSWDASRKRWYSRIEVGGKKIFLGRFTEIASASAAYAMANKKYFGEFGGRL